MILNIESFLIQISLTKSIQLRTNRTCARAATLWSAKVPQPPTSPPATRFKKERIVFFKGILCKWRQWKRLIVRKEPHNGTRMVQYQAMEETAKRIFFAADGKVFSLFPISYHNIRFQNLYHMLNFVINFLYQFPISNSKITFQYWIGVSIG